MPYLTTPKSDPKNIYVAIGPSLGPEHAEFRDYKTLFPNTFYAYRWKEYLFNLWEIAKDQLIKASIAKDHIEITPLCTFKHRELCFSYRREKKTGRMVTLVALNPQLATYPTKIG